MAPSTGGGHALAELPGGIPWSEDPQTSGNAQGGVGIREPREQPPEWSPKDRAQSPGTARATSPRRLPAPGWVAVWGCQGGVCASAPQRGRGARSRRGSGAAEHVGLQLAAAAPAAPARQAGGAGVSGRLRPWPCLGCAAPSCLTPSFFSFSPSPSPGPPMTFVSICKVTAALSRQDDAEATSALPRLVWPGGRSGGDTARTRGTLTHAACSAHPETAG